MNIEKIFFCKKDIVQFIKFGIVGVSNTVIAFGIYYVLYFWGIHYVISNFFGWAVGVLNGFYWNNKYVFNSSKNCLSALFKTYISYGISFLTGTILLWGMVELFSVSPVIAPIICLLVTVPLNFLLNKYWTFK